ncbi:MAG: RidA family protein [Eubacterium sp.]|nr:RidA family protein [Eubacterium sp.]
MEYVATNNAPNAIGPYSQAVKANGMLFTSGQIAINPISNNVEASTIEEQTIQVCENLKAVVEAAGTTMDKVVKTTCFLADINDFAAFNEIYGRYFTSKPARSCVAVKDLPKGVLCEVELIAEL